MFLGATGTPMRNTAFANKELALAEPEPLTLANLITKSFIFILQLADFSLVLLCKETVAYPRLR